jgi:hypothetical protein
MTANLNRALLAATTIAARAGSTIAPLASADAAPAKHSRTMTVCVKSAYIDASAPGKIFIGTIFKGNHFHVDRSVRVESGSAKGLWRHGTRIATGSKGTYTRPSAGSSTPPSATSWWPQAPNDEGLPLGSPSHFLKLGWPTPRRAASALRPATAAS